MSITCIRAPEAGEVSFRIGGWPLAVLLVGGGSGLFLCRGALLNAGVASGQQWDAKE